jgi:hypothetical protein
VIFPRARHALMVQSRTLHTVAASVAVTRVSAPSGSETVVKRATLRTCKIPRRPKPNGGSWVKLGRVVLLATTLHEGYGE